MKWIVLIGRLIFGGWFLYAGLNHWIPITPQPMGETLLGRQVVDALMASHLFDVVKAIELVVGALVLANRFTALALNVCMPISVVVFYWNVFIEKSPIGAGMGTATLALNALLMLAYFDHYRSVLAWRPHITGARK